MRRYGHWGLTMLLAVPVIFLLPVPYAIPIVGMMLSMSLVPNREIGVSLLGRRSITHTVWFALVMGGVIQLFVTGLLTLVRVGIVDLVGTAPAVLQPWFIGLLFATGTVLGILGHLMGDILVGGDSKPPVTPLWPVLRTPVRLAVTNHRNPLVNDALFKFMVVVSILVWAIRLRIHPIYLY